MMLGWLFKWRDKVDIGLRPRHATTGAEINLYPFTARGANWLERNIDQFSKPVWSRQDRCIELSDLDTLQLHRIVNMIEEAGLKMRFYGRLKGWDGQSPIWRELMRD